MRRPHKIDEDSVGEYGVSVPGHSTAAFEGVTIPFYCRLCGTLLRGSVAEVGTELTCPDCGTKTVVPPQKKIGIKAVVGAATVADVGEYGLCEPNIGVVSDIPVVCCLCNSRLMARADQVGKKIRCPDCGAQTAVTAPLRRKTGAVMGVMAETSRTAADDYSVSVSAASPTARKSLVEKVVYIGVACPRCGTRIHATDRQVGQKVPCPDCDTPITIPPPKADAIVEEQIVGGSQEYAVGAPQEVLSQVPMPSRALPKDPADDPDFDFLDKVDGSPMRWLLRDRSDKLGFLGHPDASSRWFGFCLGGVGAFTMLAVAFLLFGTPSLWGSEEIAWFLACGSFAIAGLICLAWAGLFSLSLVAIVQDTAAGNRVVQNWPESDWLEQIGESLYVFNSCMVSFIPVYILLQTYPPACPFAVYLYTAGFWLTFPLVLLSMLETGSVLTPVSRNVAASLYRCPGAWSWFYLRSFGLVSVALAIYIALWQLWGPIVLPVLAPAVTTFAMIYARWLGILGIGVQETIEVAAEA
jgi:DNA-directed RNA polymerase subunit RPC12/RpoP